MTDPVAIARSVIERRRRSQPEHQFYAYAGREMMRLDHALANGGQPDRRLYEALTLGLGRMCARELETVDPDFCRVVYALLAEVRRRADC